LSEVDDVGAGGGLGGRAWRASFGCGLASGDWRAEPAEIQRVIRR
jgi:hypothetical protein